MSNGHGAKQRYISTSFWDDPYIQKLLPEFKLVYIYFLTCPLTTIAGVYEISIRRIVFDTGLTEDIVTKALKIFEEEKKIFYANSKIIIRNFPSHQKWKIRSKINEGIRNILSDFDSDFLKYLVSIDYTYPIDTLPNYINCDLKNENEINGENESKLEPDLMGN